MGDFRRHSNFVIRMFDYQENFMRPIAVLVQRAASLVIALVALSSATTFAQIVDRPIPGDPVRIDSGRVAGKLLPSGVKAYFGIPYVAAPVRELRWRDPQPVKPWQGVLNADRFGPECIQVLRRKNLNHYVGEEPTSEDCLFLNVWAAPEAHAGAKLPVVVFIHGGGFTLGSSGMALYGGENVARAGAVFVNFNYRVGALGFMAHPELDAESPHHSSGDYGFLDMVAALQWVQRNIDRFGGDANNVTVTGQSAGSAAVSALAASPLAKGLFHRGMGMSLSLFDSRLALMPNAQAEQTGLAIQNALGAKSLAELRMLPADRILALQKDCQLDCGAGSLAVGPTVDGYFLPDTVDAIFAAGRQNDVAMISGFTRDESTNSLRTAADQAAYVAEARRLYGEQADRFPCSIPPPLTPRRTRWGLPRRASRKPNWATGIGRARMWRPGRRRTTCTCSRVCIPLPTTRRSMTTCGPSALITRPMCPTGSRRRTASTCSARHATGPPTTVSCRHA